MLDAPAYEPSVAVGEPEQSETTQPIPGDTLRSRETSPTNSAGAPEVTTGSSTTVSDDARRKWSEAELHELMFCFFKARAGGPGYIKRFKDLNHGNPKIQKCTGNTLSNQARSIISRKVLSTQVLDQIRSKAEDSVTHNEDDIIAQNSPTTLTSPLRTVTDTPTENITQHPLAQQSQTFTPECQQITPEITVEPFIDTPDVEVDETQDPIILQFLEVLADTKEMSVESRENLPKPNFNKQFIQNLNTINNFLPNLLITNTSLREINDIIYAAAKTLVSSNNQKPYTNPTSRKAKRDPLWKTRLKNKIEDFRKELARLIEIKRGNNSRPMNRIRQNLFDKYNIRNDQDLEYRIELHTQKVKALAGRVKRYSDMNDRKEQNKLFQENQHKFYRSLNGEQQVPTQIHSQGEIQRFWSSILSEPVPYNHGARWIAEVEESM